MSAAETVQIACVTGDVSILGAAGITGTVNVYGVTAVVANGTDATLNDYSVSRTNINTEVDTSMTEFTGDTGITLPKALEMLAAFIAGKVTATSALGVTTYTYLKRDGAATSFTAACTEADGTRATTGSLT